MCTVLSAAVHIKMEPKTLCYKPSSAESYNKRRNGGVKIDILNEVVINRRKNELSTPSSVKTELRRIAVERRSIHVENQKIIREVHSETFLLPDCGLLKRYVVAGHVKNLAFSKSTVNLQNIRLNTRIFCIVLSVESLLI